MQKLREKRSERGRDRVKKGVGGGIVIQGASLCPHGLSARTINYPLIPSKKTSPSTLVLVLLRVLVDEPEILTLTHTQAFIHIRYTQRHIHKRVERTQIQFRARGIRSAVSTRTGVFYRHIWWNTLRPIVFQTAESERARKEERDKWKRAIRERHEWENDAEYFATYILFSHCRRDASHHKLHDHWHKLAWYWIQEEYEKIKKKKKDLKNMEMQ